MSKAQLVLQVLFNKLKTSANTLVDVDFSILPFLTTQEAVMNMKGEKVSKSYYTLQGKEAVKIVYSRIIRTYTFKGVDYPGTFIGLKKSIQFIDWVGNVGYEKKKQPYYFNLQPVFVGDGTETVTGFSSPKLRQILKAERYNADDYLQAQNPDLYSLLYNSYNQYESYLRTGDKTALVTAINNEQNAGINAVFNNTVYGTEITVKQLILDNLQ